MNGGSSAVTVADLYQAQRIALGLRLSAGRERLEARLATVGRAQPERALVGFMNLIHPHRVQVLGRTELTYLRRLDAADRQQFVAALCGSRHTRALIVADDCGVPRWLAEAARAGAVSVLAARAAASEVVHALHFFLARVLARTETRHGVFMEVAGVGVLITGSSGIGKSEAALDLLTRRHRLIADDVVLLRQVAPDSLEGHCPAALQDYIEIRGLGVLNAREMFGDTAIVHARSLDLIVRLEAASEQRMRRLDRLRGTSRTRNVLGVDIPEVRLFVAPGRNMAVLVEAAARNYILVWKGHDPVEAFANKQQRLIRRRRGDR